MFLVIDPPLALKPHFDRFHLVRRLAFHVGYTRKEAIWLVSPLPIYLFILWTADFVECVRTTPTYVTTFGLLILCYHPRLDLLGPPTARVTLNHQRRAF